MCWELQQGVRGDRWECNSWEVRLSQVLHLGSSISWSIMGLSHRLGRALLTDNTATTRWLDGGREGWTTASTGIFVIHELVFFSEFWFNKAQAALPKRGLHLTKQQTDKAELLVVDATRSHTIHCYFKKVGLNFYTDIIIWKSLNLYHWIFKCFSYLCLTKKGEIYCTYYQMLRMIKTMCKQFS